MNKKIIAIMIVAVVLAAPIIMADKETNSKKITSEVSDNEDSNDQHKCQIKHQQNIIDDLPNAIRGHRQNGKNDREDAEENEEDHTIDINPWNSMPEHKANAAGGEDIPININPWNTQPRHDFDSLPKHDDENEYDDEKRFVNLTEMAQKQIDVATALINDANNALNNTSLTQKQITKAQHAIDKAEKHLAKARKAFSNGKYGKAFGQATAARVHALHALRILKIMAIPPVVHWVRISGTIFNDINGNGIMNSGDNGLANWTVFIDTNGNGLLDNETITTTTAVGRYSFANLTPGNYTVREIAMPGWTNTTSPAAAVQVLKGRAAVANFGNFKLGEINGIVFNDANNNSIMDNETGLANWTVVLAGAINATTQTNATGAYQFTGLLPGTYSVSEALQTNWTQTSPAAKAYTISITSGVIAENKNFGNDPHSTNSFSNPNHGTRRFFIF